MEQNQIIDTLKEAVNYLKDDKVSYEDENGNILSLEKAMSDKTFVRPVDGKVKAQELLSNIGLDISQNSVKKLLSELVNSLEGRGSGSGSRPSKRLSKDEKKNLVREFHESGSKSKREFTSNKGVGYQSFLKWEKEFSSN